MPQIMKVQRETPLETRLLRVAAYCRVSSDSTDQLHSYAAQIKYYTEYIGQQPDWELADIYADEGLTGTKTEKRDDLHRLIADCRKGKVDRVLVKSVARFARNTTDCLALARMLKSYGTSVCFEEEDIDTAEMNDEMYLTTNGMQAQEGSITISNNMRWHYRGRMEKGDFVGTVSAYGYRLVNRTLEINEAEDTVVCRIFAMYLSGIGKQTIANILNAEGVPRRYGHTKWYVVTINYILNNERYIGDALLQKNYTTEFPFRKMKNNGEKPQWYVENNHPPLISRDAFDAVQTFQASKRRNGSAKGGHSLTRKIICSDCGHTFRRLIVNGIAYWQCCYHTSGRSICGGVRFTEETVYDSFLLLVNKLTANREYILTPLIAQLECMRKRQTGTVSKVYEIDRQIAELTKQIHILTQHSTKGLMDAAVFAAQSGAVNQKISALRAERRKLLAEDANDEMLDALCALNNILTLTDPQTTFDERVFDQIVTHITAASDTELRFQLLGGLELTEAISRTERRTNP